MAENEENKAPEGGNERASASPAKTLLVLLSVLLIEGGTIGATMYFAGGPREVKGVEREAERSDKADEPVEVLVIEGRFPNMQTGRHLLYDTEVYITVRRRYVDQIKKDLEAMKAQLSMSIATIIRRAHPSYFQEATLATLRRQMKGMFDEQLGLTPDNESYIQQVLITRCNPFRADL